MKVTIHLAYRCSSHKKGSGINGTNLRINMSTFNSFTIFRTSHVKSQPITSKYFAQEYNFLEPTNKLRYLAYVYVSVMILMRLSVLRCMSTIRELKQATFLTTRTS